MKTLREMMDLIEFTDYVDVLEEAERAFLKALTDDEVALLENNLNNGFQDLKKTIEEFAKKSLTLSENNIGEKFYPFSFFTMMTVPMMNISMPEKNVTLYNIDHSGTYYFKDDMGKSFKFPEDIDSENRFYQRIIFKDKQEADEMITWLTIGKPDNWKFLNQFNKPIS